MRLRFLTLVAVALVVGCGPADSQEAEELRDAVPTSAALQMDVPSASGEQAAGQKTFALVGQRADLYQLTHDTTRNLNGAIWVGLQVIEEIVQHPVTTLNAGVATWGPYTPPLAPLTWLLVVKKEKLRGHYSYVLTARLKGDTAGKFVPILGGTSRKGVGGYVGIYAASASALHQLDPQTHPSTGKLIARYDTRLGQRFVALALGEFSENGEEPVDLAYRYRAFHNGAGLFRFVAKADINKNGSAEENIAVATQWNETGAGRGDALISGGDVPAGVVVHLTECWDDGFGRTFYADNAGINPTEGDKAQCVFGQPAAEQPDPTADLPEPELPENAQ